MSDTGDPLLSVEDLRVEFPTPDGIVHAVDGISYTVARSGTLGIVGESGSGKTVAALTLIGLTRTQGAHVSGRIMFGGRDLLALSNNELRSVRGNDIAMVFQDPLSSLHPQFRVGAQIVEAMRIHRQISRQAAKARAIELLERLQAELGMAIIMITHDLGVVAEIADDIAVMYAGRIVERADARSLFASPQHPYTWGLLRSIPSLEGPRGVELTPIPGRPPSLIRPPSGCHFHPRCAYSLPEHAVTDPSLVALAEDSSHAVACLLDPAQRAAAWRELRAGGTIDSARSAAGIAAEETLTEEVAG